jgi:hypothetical protein
MAMALTNDGHASTGARAGLTSVLLFEDEPGTVLNNAASGVTFLFALVAVISYLSSPCVDGLALNGYQ